MNAEAPNLYRRYSRREDHILARRKFDRVNHKLIARELGRTTGSVNSRFQTLMDKLECAHGDILQRHREQELALLERLLAEAQMPEVHREEEE